MNTETELLCDAFEAIIAAYHQRLDFEAARIELVVKAALAVGDVETMRAIEDALGSPRPLNANVVEGADGVGKHAEMHTDCTLTATETALSKGGILRNRGGSPHRNPRGAKSSAFAN